MVNGDPVRLPVKSSSDLLQAYSKSNIYSPLHLGDCPTNGLGTLEETIIKWKVFWDPFRYGLTYLNLAW
jgi:hypothetical protein